MKIRKILLIWMFTVLLTACSSGNDVSLPDVQERDRQDVIDTEQIQKEHELSLRETLNITFKLMAAMQSNNYTYLESVSSPNIEISKQNNIIISKLEQEDYEVPFLQNVSLNHLEYRGFNPLDSDRVILHMALVRSDGNSALDIYFTRTEEGNWLFDGLLTNG